jgi:hypothetical protein
MITLNAWGRSSVWLERFPVTEEVAGSSPVGPAIKAQLFYKNFSFLEVKNIL